MTPFVKWLGGKRQLLGKLKAYMPESYTRYYEPFIGGGALFLDIQPKQAVINDINEQLLNIYQQLKTDAETVIKEVNHLDKTPCDKERYLKIREQFNNKIKKRELDAQCAALMIYVNKHCFNGLYRINKEGFFNAAYNKKTSGPSIDEGNLRKISSYLKGNDIQIRLGDFEIACEDVKPDDFVYFDSPYLSISKTASFTEYTKDGFTLHDHQRLAELFKRLTSQGTKVMLSNSISPLVYELYKDYKIIHLDERRLINSDVTNRKGKGVLIVNYEK